MSDEREVKRGDGDKAYASWLRATKIAPNGKPVDLRVASYSNDDEVRDVLIEEEIRFLRMMLDSGAGIVSVSYSDREFVDRVLSSLTEEQRKRVDIGIDPFSNI